MTKVYLITGFLGSGKTTFLNHRLNQLTTKVGVLMNEFGKISMDTIAIKKSEVDLVELKNGSIFCACLKDYFLTGLEKLVRMNLDEIYIESSGLADPSDMEKVVAIITKLVGEKVFTFEGTICLVDGLFFKQELAKMVSVEKQIRHSHHVLINKSDLISEDQLEEIRTIIKGINPEVGITSTTFGEVNLEELGIEAFHIEDEVTTNTQESKPKNILIKFKLEPSMGQLKSFLNQMTQHFYRIKGFVLIESTWYKIDLVNEQIQIEPYEVRKENMDLEGFNELVCLSSKGLYSISHLAQVAEKELAMLYTMEM